MKVPRKHLAMAYWGKTIKEWRAGKRFAEWEIRRMIVEACEYSEVLGLSDVGTIYEFADDLRVA